MINVWVLCCSTYMLIQGTEESRWSSFPSLISITREWNMWRIDTLKINHEIIWLHNINKWFRRGKVLLTKNTAEVAANNGGTAAYVSVLFDRMLIYNLYKLMGKIKDFWKRIKTFGHYTLNIRSFKSLSWTTITQSKCIHCQDKHGTNINIPHLSYNQQKKHTLQVRVLVNCVVFVCERKISHE